MSQTFEMDTTEIINILTREKDIEINVLLKSERFFRCQLKSNGLNLKLEFINDVQYHFGDFNGFELFSKVDNVFNILSNKVTAIIDRDEPKDFADILFIWKKYSPDWKQIFQSAMSKAAGVFPPLFAEKIANFDLDSLSNIKWIENQDIEKIKMDREKLIINILGMI